MAHIIIPPGWKIPEQEATPESIYLDRRRFIRQLGYSGLGLWALMNGAAGSARAGQSSSGLYPAPRNSAFTPDRPLTAERVAATYNNFYEFTLDKDRVHKLAKNFKTRPWRIEVSGEVEKPFTIDIDTLVRKLPLEERLYRFRCVEAWSMAVPWTGIPMKKFIEMAKPTSQAKYVRFVTFLDPKQAPGQRTQSWYPWPYFEGLRMDEAMNELTMLVTGIYGHPLPNQHGAPIRLIVPWKYGFKSIKSIVSIEFTREQPRTFWNQLVPDEYDFLANVNPQMAHPRWSQATERIIPSGKRVPTLMYNGYAEYVADLY